MDYRTIYKIKTSVDIMKRLGIYIDLENITHLDYDINFKLMLEDILYFYKRSLKDNEIYYSIKKSYGDAKSIRKYAKILRDLNIDIVYSVPVNKAKNMSDMISSIDSFEDFVIYKKLDIVIFVTRYVDYTVLMERLNRYGANTAIVTISENTKRDIFKSSCNNIFKIEDYKINFLKESKDNSEENQISKNDFLKFFYNRVIDINYGNNINDVKIQISDICNKVNEDFNLEKGKSAIKQTQFKEIKNLLEYFKNNKIETEMYGDYFIIKDMNAFNSIMSNILNLNNINISEKDFVNAFIESLSDYEENVDISLASIMNEINKKFRIEKGSSAIKHTNFKKPSKFINYLIRNSINIELNNKGNNFKINDKENLFTKLKNLFN